MVVSLYSSGLIIAIGGTSAEAYSCWVLDASTSSPILDRVSSESKERGEKTAENARYGQSISEGGFGGMTTTSGGSANQEGFGAVKGQDESTENTRREQRYGPGTNIGA